MKYCVYPCDQLLYDDNTNEKKCISFENCIKLGYFKSESVFECISECPHFYYQSKSEENCGNGHENHNKDQKECISECISPYQYLDESQKICFDKCPSNFINEGTTLCTNEEDISSCFYKYDDTQNKICYSDCPDGYKYHNHNEKICRPDCTTNNGNINYHIKDQYDCYTSCFIEGVAYNQRDYVCSIEPCSFYSTIDNDVKKCFYNEESCFANGYYYIKEDNTKGNECFINTWHNDFNNKIKYNKYNEIQTYKCLAKQECISKGYYYYNTEYKECWQDSCPEGMFINVIGL